MNLVGRFAPGTAAGLSPGVAKPSNRFIVFHSPDSIHAPSGLIVSKELLYASSAPSAWTYSRHVPSGAWARYIFAVAPACSYGSTYHPATESGSPTWSQPSPRTDSGIVPTPV